MKVSAMAALAKGATLQPYGFETGALGPNGCLVRVTHCGICHSDVHMIDDDWKRTRYPLVPGHEVVGEVVEVGPGVDTLRVGDRVGVGWQRSACLTCRDCLSGNENLCLHNRGTITHGHGGFADYLEIDSRFAFLLPPRLDSPLAGPLMCGGLTVYSALRHAGMTTGMEVGVVGVGGLGHLAVQFAAKLGNRVTAFTTSDDKADFAHRLGAAAAIVSKGPKPGKKPGEPLRVLVSTAPVDLDWAAYVDLLGPDGTLVFVGIPPHPLTVHPGLLLDRRRRIMASPIGGRAAMVEMLETAARIGVAPVVETFPRSEANRAIARVRSNEVRYRAVLAA